MDSKYEIEREILKLNKEILISNKRIEDINTNIYQYKDALKNGFIIIFAIGSMAIVPLYVNNVISINTTLISMATLMTGDLINLGIGLNTLRVKKVELDGEIENNEKIIDDNLSKIASYKMLLNNLEEQNLDNHKVVFHSNTQDKKLVLKR